MTRVALQGGSYVDRSPAASAQRVLNLIPSSPPPTEADQPWPHYPTPGLTVLTIGGSGSLVVRGLYQYGGAGNIVLIVIGGSVYTFDISSSSLTFLGNITNLTTPVSMQGAGTGYVVITDGGSNGWYVTPTFSLVAITDTAFSGSVSLCFLDTFLVFNKPGTAQFYVGPSNYAGNATPFDPLAIATKDSYVDTIAGLATVNQIIWVIGIQTTELWYDSGAPDFPLQRVPEVLFQHGCVAPRSIATTDSGVFWLSQDLQGRNIVLHGQGYNVNRISTPAVEYAFSQISTTSDCVAFTYSQAGHVFYVMNFTTGDQTWVYDVTTQMWHERCYLNGTNEERARPNCAVSVSHLLGTTSTILCGDYNNGHVYVYDENNYTDNNVPIKRQRTFPHLLNDGNRVIYDRFMLDMSGMFSTTALISLDWSDNRGLSYHTPVTLPMTNNVDGGSLTWWRLGMARDRLFRVTWTAPMETMIQGAWVDVRPTVS